MRSSITVKFVSIKLYFYTSWTPSDNIWITNPCTEGRSKFKNTWARPPHNNRMVLKSIYYRAEKWPSLIILGNLVIVLILSISTVFYYMIKSFGRLILWQRDNVLGRIIIKTRANDLMDAPHYIVIFEGVIYLYITLLEWIILWFLYVYWYYISTYIKIFAKNHGPSYAI